MDHYKPQYKPFIDWIDQQAPSLKGELLALSSINSGSFNAAGVNATAARLAQRFSPLASRTEEIEVAPFQSTSDDGALRERTLGRALRIRAREHAPLQIFFCGH